MLHHPDGASGSRSLNVYVARIIITSWQVDV